MPLLLRFVQAAVQLGHGLGSCCTMSLGSGLAARLSTRLVAVFAFTGYGFASSHCRSVVLLQLVLGCPVRGGNRQVSGHADRLWCLWLLGLAHLLGWGLLG